MTNKKEAGMNGQGSDQRVPMVLTKGANLLNESSSFQINKSIQFEVSGEKIIVSVTIEQCHKNNCKKVIPLLKTIFDEIETILAD